MSVRPNFEHFASDDPSRLDRRYCCECCGYPTLGFPNNYEICTLCNWMEERSGQVDWMEARANFRNHLTKYPPGSNGFKADDFDRIRSVKRLLIKAYDEYMAEPNLHRRTALWREAQRIEDTL